MNSQVSEQVINIIVEQFQQPKELVVPEADFSNDLAFDSLEKVEFIMAVEEAFCIDVPDEEAERIKTVQQAIDNIEQARKNLLDKEKP
jgi:acyl carrier protein